MSLLLSFLGAGALLIALFATFAVTNGVLMMTLRQPWLWILAAPLAGYWLAWLALHFGLSAGWVTAALATFLLAMMNAARIPKGPGRAEMIEVKAELWRLRGMPHGSAQTWFGIAGMVAAGLVAVWPAFS